MVAKPVGALAGPALDRLAQDLTRLAGFLGLNGGSNNWTMNASRTTTGRPILANDPHLGPMAPAPWYLAHIQAPGLKVAGATYVGAPTFPSGHNETAAWGVTASVADNIDLFIEELGPEGKTVREGDDFVPCEIYHELISVRGKDAVQEEVIVTPRGPIISDLLDGVSSVLSFAATWMSPIHCEGLVKLHRCKDFESFREAVSQARIISQNFVYADTSDNIGWQYTADVPQRGESWGTVPLPGRDSRFHWKAASTPWDEMPNLFNPETNFIATANQKPLPDSDGTYLGQDFIEGYRHARIIELLAARQDWNLDSAQMMQTDQFAIPWREMKAVVLGVSAKTEDAKIALKLLGDWDGVTSPDSAGAAVYEYFVLEMLHRLAHAKAPNSAAWILGKGFHPLVLTSFFYIREVSHLVRRLREQPQGWFAGGWEAEIAAALSAAVGRLKQTIGPSPEEWAWGKVHQLVLAHLMGSRPPLDKIFNLGPFPTGGDHQTIAQAGRASTEFGSKVDGLANLRIVHDVGNWDDNRVVIAGGQSGNPFSPHYDDLLQFWLRGRTVTMPWSEETIRRATQQSLRLVPVW
jgi:penicillin amidase